MIGRDTFVRAEAARAGDGATTTTTVATQACTVFRLGRLWFAFDALQVAEVATASELTAVPGAPARVHGLINLRGRAVPVLDIAAFLELSAEDHPEEPLRRILVVASESMRVGMSCDQVLGVEHLPVDEITDVHGQRATKSVRFATGEVERPFGLVTLLDLAGILQAARVSST